MKNYRPTNVSNVILPVEDDAQIVAVCVNDEHSTIAAATDQGSVLVLHTAEEGSTGGRGVELSRVVSLGGDGATVTCMAYSIELEGVNIGLSDGSLYLLHLASGALELIGRLDAAVLDLCWSPDSELLAVATARGKLLLMTQTWDVDSEVHMQQLPDGGAAEAAGTYDYGSVAVSWRGDAQFLATASQSTEEESATLRVWERRGCVLHSTGDAAVVALTPALAWQPNGRHIYCGQNLGRAQKVALFERNGLGHGAFEACTEDSLQIRATAWSADSELLALVLSGEAGEPCEWVYQVWHRNNWHWYLKLERRFPRCRALYLRWSESRPATLHTLTGDGAYQALDLLTAVDVSPLATAAVVDGRDVLLTPLRHAVVPPPMAAARVRHERPVVCVGWGRVAGCEALAAALSDGRLAVTLAVEDDFWEDTAAEAGGGDPPAAGELVQDQWPPIAACTLEHDVPELYGRTVRHVLWLSSTHILLVATPDPRSDATPGDILVSVRLSWPQVHPDDNPSQARPDVASTAEAPCGATVCCCCVAADGRAVLQTLRGRLLLLTEDGGGGGVGELREIGAFPEPCDTVVVPPAEALPAHLRFGASACFGLSASGCLYSGGSLLARGATSVCCRHDGPGGAFLCYTTRANALHLLPLAPLLESGPPLGADATPTALPDSSQRLRANTGLGAGKRDNLYTAMHAAMRPDVAHDVRDGSARAMEAGACLIAAPPPPAAHTCVVQMPRGNLETVQPRPLVLASVAAHLLRGEFAAAFRAAAVARLHLSVLVDFLWPASLASFPEFVRQVPREEDLCDLLASVRPGDCTAPGEPYACVAAMRPHPQADAAAMSMLDRVMGAGDDGAAAAPPAAAAGGGAPPQGGALDDKVNRVCAAVRAACTEIDADAFRRVVIMSYIRSEPSDLEAALRVVRAAKERELGGVDASTSGRPTAEDLVRFILLHVEPEAAYRAALCMYDLQMGYMVIASSQRDPGEFLLQLQAFAAEPDERLRRHRVDVHLGRWEPALEHLVAAGPGHADAAVAFARQHGLLRQLLRLLDAPGLEGARSAAMQSYAQWLEGKGRCDDAAVAFLACARPADAQRCYLYAGEWHMAFSLAMQLQQPPAALRKMAAAMIEQLGRMGRSEDAGHVAATYLQDAAMAVQLFVDGGHWRLALNVAHQGSRGDLLEGAIAPAAARAAARLLEDLRADEARVAKYLARLGDLGAKRAALGQLDGGDDDPDPLADGFSDVASLASNMSAYTTRSTAAGSLATSSGAASTQGGRGGARAGAKKRRGGKIRQGSPEEEQKLVLLLSELAPSGAMTTQISQLTELLVLLGHEADAGKLQAALDSLIKAFQSASESILAAPPPPSNGTPQSKSEAEATLEGLRLKRHELGRATWKWDLLRPA